MAQIKFFNIEQPIKFRKHDIESILNALVKNDEFNANMKKAAEQTYFTRFYSERSGFDQDYLDRMAYKYIENKDAFIENMYDQTEAIRNHYVKEQFEDFLEDYVNEILEFFEEKNLWCQKDEIMSSFSEYLFDDFCEIVSDSDDSKISDLFSNHEYVQIAFVPNMIGFAWDDLYIKLSTLETDLSILPNDNFVNYLKMLEISPSEIVEYVRTHYDSEFPVVTVEENDGKYKIQDKKIFQALWEILVEIENTGDYDISRFDFLEDYYQNEYITIANAMKNEMRQFPRYDRKPKVTIEKFMEIFNNSYFSNTPLISTRISAKDFFSGNLENGIRLIPTYNRERIFASAEIGLVDLLNGSNACEKTTEEIKINLNHYDIIVPGESTNYRLDPFFTAGIVSDVTAGWHKTHENIWTSDYNRERGYATIEEENDSYVLQIFKRDGTLISQHTDFESFENACEAGNQELYHSNTEENSLKM